MASRCCTNNHYNACHFLPGYSAINPCQSVSIGVSHPASETPQSQLPCIHDPGEERLPTAPSSSTSRHGVRSATLALEVSLVVTKFSFLLDLRLGALLPWLAFPKWVAPLPLNLGFDTNEEDNYKADWLPTTITFNVIIKSRPLPLGPPLNMTSMASESVATILCTSKQTRFHIDTANYRQLDIEGVNITIVGGSKSGASAKGKSKARSEGLEILSGAKLRLQEGRRYALVGRNGTGKSTLLKAIAEKLIPGIPEQARIAILQQTKLNDGEPPKDETSTAQLSIRQEVIERATSRSLVEQEIQTLSDGVNSTDPFAPVRAVRRLKHERLQKRHFLLDKDARLRSGARGMAARKALVAIEKAVAASQELVDQPNADMTANALHEETQEAADMLAELQIQVEPGRVSEIETRARRILTGLGFTEAVMEQPLASLSGGWHMRASLAAVLLQDADVLILDEPTNFLDLLGIIWLQKYLEALGDADRPPTLLLVSHDRDFLSLCTDLLILKDKELAYFHGNLPTFEAARAERKDHLRKMKDAQDKQKAHIEKTIAHNLKTGRQNDDQNKIRQAKSRQKKLDDRWGLQVNARGHRFRLNDQAGFFHTSHQQIDVGADERPVVLALPAPSDLRFPGSLLSLDRASFRYAPSAPAVVKDVSLTVGMGDRVGILGLNGAGKSTLVRLLVDAARPTAGAATRHPRLKLSYYAQHAVDELQARGRADVGLTALALLTADVDGQLAEGEVRGLLGELGLPGRFASDVPVARLSGGQLVRCALARLLWRRPHCLVLDEITTHLDYETVTALRAALRHWEGAVVLVSHDRWFMRGVIDGVVEEDDGEESDGEEEDGDAPIRRRVMYRLKGGEMTVLKNGVDEFENIMEKRVKKLLAA
ncbi:ABC transporter, putative [Cordyceps militaris CM01]|uniref:ABC transporter, putative n=1 Tax=Cordyceps militaris (strain CM01) TaxID=983644 RepID=G3JGQ2_CORMM|nr:ABC transporter, putative [Cordyceps militaris CM01]EGX93321.1 ABC transporter, putative [Cordyceps militaris CM01]